MRANVTLELQPREYEMLKKALFTYDNKINSLLNKDIDLSTTQKFMNEQKILSVMIRNLQ